MQIISGISHFAVIGRHTGSRLSNWISRTPLMVQFYLTGGILTATFTRAFSFFRILKRTSSKYQNLSLLLTEKTYSSKASNSLLLHLAITLSMRGFPFSLSYRRSSFKPIATSTSSIDPGKRIFLPKDMLVLLISTKYFVSSKTQFQEDLKFSSPLSFFVESFFPSLFAFFSQIYISFIIFSISFVPSSYDAKQYVQYNWCFVLIVPFLFHCFKSLAIFPKLQAPIFKEYLP